jgi:hypothetical protein
MLEAEAVCAPGCTLRRVARMPAVLTHRRLKCSPSPAPWPQQGPRPPPPTMHARRLFKSPGLMARAAPDMCWVSSKSSGCVPTFLGGSAGSRLSALLRLLVPTSNPCLPNHYSSVDDGRQLNVPLSRRGMK